MPRMPMDPMNPMGQMGMGGAPMGRSPMMGRDPAAETMDFFNEMSMQNPDMPVIDNEAAMLVDVDSANFHALDVPDTWRDANPYALDQGVPFGTGYPDVTSQMPMGQPSEPVNIRALREATYGEMTQQRGKDRQYQEKSMDENEQLMRAGRRR